MSLCDIIKVTSILVRGTITVAVAIRDAERTRAELKELARCIATELTIAGGLLENLQKFSQRVSVQGESLLINNINALRPIITQAQTVLENVRRNRNFVERLFMRPDEYRRQLREISTHLHRSMMTIYTALPTIDKIKIRSQQFPDFRKLFKNVPETTIHFYDFNIIMNTNNSVLKITFDQFDTTQRLCYMRQGNDQLFFSYQMRTWTALDPRQIVLKRRREDFRAGKNNGVGLNDSPAAAPNTTRERIDFSEFFMPPDDICGMTVTRSFIYMATKCGITIGSLSTQRIIAQYGVEGDGPKSFRDISYIYIPSNDETNLYIVDRGQYAVHQYKIHGSDLRFEYVRQYVVIAEVSERCNLISCVIYKRNLYVSDDANNCLHIFPLNGERQSTYLVDNSMTPFSPGSLCTDGKHLYVANCSAESPGILIFNEECQPVAWFRNRLLREILAIDIDPNINELYVVTTEIVHEDGEQKKRPLIVSMLSVVHT